MSDFSKTPKTLTQESPTKRSKSQMPLTSRLSSGYEFAKHPAMNRTWLRNLLFGLAIAMPLSLYGLEAGLWQAKDLLEVYGIVVVTCLFLLPIYAAIVRQLP